MIEIERLKEKNIDYQKALSRLIEGLNVKPTSDIIFDGVIQRFEFTFELSWKLMKAYLVYQGYENINSPRTTIRTAFENNIIEDGEAWIDIMMDRNRTSHIYDEKKAREIYLKIKDCHSEKSKLLRKFMEKNI